MAVKFNSSGGGSVTLDAPSTASNLTVTLPSASGTLVSTGSPFSGGTANGVVYLNGSSVPTTGSALTFDGTNLVTTGYAAGNGLRSLGGNAVRFYNAANGNWSQISTPVGTGDMQFDTGAGEQMRLTSTGLGIGTSSPAAALTVYRSTANSMITLDQGTPASYHSLLNFQLSGATKAYFGVAGVAGGITSGSASGDLIGRTNGNSFRFTVNDGTTNAVVINTSQNVQNYGSISVGNATPTTSGAGITFPATQSASSDANTLDDYEEGTFTPAFANNGTYAYSRQFGRYTKIGRIVNIYIDLILSSQSGGSGTPLISALPFAVNTGAAATISMFYAGDNNWPVPRSNLTALLDNGTVLIYCYFNSGNNIASFSITDIGNTGRIIVNGSYQTS